MAKIALIETFPHESLRNGDGAQGFAMACALAADGHEVRFVVTDMRRGRTRPWYAVAFPDGGFQWRVRGGVKIGRHVVSYAPDFWLAFAGAAMARLMKRERPDKPMPKADYAALTASGEAAWLRRTMDASAPDVALSWLDAAYIMPALDDWPGRKLIAIAVHLGAPGAYQVNPHARAYEEADDTFDPVQGARLKAALIAGAERAEAVFTCSHAESALIAEWIPGKPTAPLYLGYDFAPCAPPGDAPVVFHVADANKQNIASLRWLLAEVWPLVRAEVSEAQLRVAGKVCAAIPDPAPPGVTKLGFVDDIRAEYAGCAIVACPQIAGTAGLKVKLAEAIAHGRGVVASTPAFDPAAPDFFAPGAIRADHPAAFADVLIRHLKDAETRRASARAALDVRARRFEGHDGMRPLQAAVRSAPTF